MAGYQFVRTETYALSVSELTRQREIAAAKEGKSRQRKLTVEEICAEAARVEGSHPHVENAKPPILLLGVSPDEVARRVAAKVAAYNRRLREVKKAMPRGQRRGLERAIRKDSRVLWTAVASFPISWKDYETGVDNFEPGSLAEKQLEEWKKRNIAWAEHQAWKLGFELVSVVLHTDEEFPHLHILGIPLSDRLDARGCHPGEVAKNAVAEVESEDPKSYVKRRNSAYRHAMVDFQEEYYRMVSVHVGLARTGPKRRRLTRDRWLAEKQARDHDIERQYVREATEEGIERAEATRKRIEARSVSLDKDSQMAAISTQRHQMKQQKLTKAIEALERSLKETSASTAAAQEEKKKLEGQVQGIRAKLAEVERAYQTAKAESDAIAAEHAKAWAEIEAARSKVKASRRDAEERKALADTLIEGVQAFASGKLEYRPEHPTAILNLNGAGASELGPRLKAVKAILEPIIRDLHDRVEGRVRQRLTGLISAVRAGLKAWKFGLLKGVTKSKDAKDVSFEVKPGTASEELIKSIGIHRREVAEVIDVLPNRKALEERFAEVETFLTAAEHRRLRFLGSQVTPERDV